MLLNEYKVIFRDALQSIYDEQEVDSFFTIVLGHLHGMTRVDLALNPKATIDFTHLRKWKSIVSDLKKQKPIQYIVGETEFYGLRFLVNENTLIPRPETEELVELILAESRKSQVERPRILDIGTGSGCIAISLAKHISNAEVTAIDVSEKALATAQENAQENAVKVDFISADILNINNLEELPTSNFPLPAKFDIIVSNPPYVRNLEKAEIKPNVLEHEPHLALFVEDTDALLFYRKITELAKKNLNQNGKLYFEINQYLGKETVALIESYGFKKVQLLQDIYGNDRMISTSL